MLLQKELISIVKGTSLGDKTQAGEKAIHKIRQRFFKNFDFPISTLLYCLYMHHHVFIKFSSSFDPTTPPLRDTDVINGRPKKDRYQADKQKGVTQFSDNPTKLAHPHLYVSKKYKYAWLVLSRFEIPYKYTVCSPLQYFL